MIKTTQDVAARARGNSRRAPRHHDSRFSPRPVRRVCARARCVVELYSSTNRCRAVSATPPSIAIAALVLGGSESVRARALCVSQQEQQRPGWQMNVNVNGHFRPTETTTPLSYLCPFRCESQFSAFDFFCTTHTHNYKERSSCGSYESGLYPES